jgi:F420-0:gamma-glutamyl ligase
MHFYGFIPIRTRVLHPPKDDLYSVIDTSLGDVRDGDVVVVTSKIVAIHEGRCVPIDGTDKEKLVIEEADLLLRSPHHSKPLTITNHALISAAGIDESNGEGYYILLPKDSYRAAQLIRTHILKQHAITHLGVIITDSHSLLFRYGAMSVSIGCWGFKPVESHIGRTDILGES